MAVTVETTSGPSVNVAASLTFSHTITSAVGLFVGAASADAGITISATFNGTALTVLWDIDANTVYHVAGLLMVNPASGAHNIVVTFTDASGPTTVLAGGVGLLGLVSSSVAAAHRTVYTNTPASAPTVTVVDSQSGDLVIDSAVTFNTSIAVGAGQTSRVEVDNGAGSTISWGVSTESATGGNTVMSWTGGAFSGSGATALIASGGGGGFFGSPLMAIQAGRGNL